MKIITIFMLTIFFFGCSLQKHNEIANRGYTDIVNINMGDITRSDSVSENTAASILSELKKRRPNLKIYNNSLAIRACKENEWFNAREGVHCDYLITYDSDYLCWTNIEINHYSWPVIKRGHNFELAKHSSTMIEC